MYNIYILYLSYSFVYFVIDVVFSPVTTGKREEWRQLFVRTDGTIHLVNILLNDQLSLSKHSTPWLSMMRNKCFGVLLHVLNLCSDNAVSPCFFLTHSHTSLQAIQRLLQVIQDCVSASKNIFSNVKNDDELTAEFIRDSCKVAIEQAFFFIGQFISTASNTDRPRILNELYHSNISNRKKPYIFLFCTYFITHHIFRYFLPYMFSCVRWSTRLSILRYSNSNE